MPKPKTKKVKAWAVVWEDTNEFIMAFPTRNEAKHYQHIRWQGIEDFFSKVVPVHITPLTKPKKKSL